MAEATDRPTTSVTPGPGQAAAGAAPAPATDEVYRPLSLMALGGFLLAVLYALVLVVSSAFAFFGSTPLLMPLWMLGAPLAAGILCWAARRHIQASEGTLSGVPLTSWGLGLSLVMGIVYAAYYFGTYVAIEQQAGALVDDYINRLQKGDIDKAFVLCIPSDSRPPLGDNLRVDLENMFGEQRRGMPSITQYRQQQSIRLIVGDGSGTQSARMGVAAWGHNPKDQGYKVTFRYQLKNVIATFDLLVTALGTDPKADDEGRRQWRILPGECRADNVQLTAVGQHRQQCMSAAQGFTNKWASDPMAAHRMDDAWKATLPSAERAAAGELLERAGPVAALAVTGPGALGAYDSAKGQLLENWLSFRNGGLVRAPEKVFYANAEQKPHIIRAVKGLFASGPAQRSGKFMPTREMPLWTEADGRVRVAHDVEIVIVNQQMTGPEWTANARLVCESASPGGEKPEDWHLVAVELVSGRSGGPAGGPPGGPPGGGGPQMLGF
jgi:hypothetical protein